MADNAPPKRPSRVLAVSMTVGAAGEVLACIFMSLGSPNLFAFAVIFTAAVVFVVVAVMFWRDYLRPMPPDKESTRQAAGGHPVS